MAENPYTAYRNTLAGLLAGVDDHAPCGESARGDDHDWLVFTTYTEDVLIGVFCRRCGADGIIQRPKKADWERAYDAPNRPYRWHNGRAVRFINRRLDRWRQELEELEG